MTHQYPKYVFHEEFGNGELINGMHDQPAEDGSVSWFDVMFEHGIEQKISIDDLYEDTPKGRGRPPKPGSEAAKRQAEAGGQSEEAVGLEAQLLKHKDLYGQKTGPIKFADGSTHDISSGHREKALQKIRELRGAGTNPDTRDKTTASMHSSHDKFLQHIGAKPTPKKEYHPMAINKEEVQGITRLKNGTFLAVNESGEAMTFKSQSLAIQFVGEMELSPKQKKLAAAGKKINPKNNPDEIDAEDLRAVRKEEAELNEGDLSIRTLYDKYAKHSLGNGDAGNPMKAAAVKKAIVKTHGSTVMGHLEKAKNAAADDDEDAEQTHFDKARSAAGDSDRLTSGTGRSATRKAAGSSYKFTNESGKSGSTIAKVKATEEVEEEADHKDSVYVESNRFRGVENSIRSVMENNTNLRKLAEVAKWKKNNPE